MTRSHKRRTLPWRSDLTAAVLVAVAALTVRAAFTAQVNYEDPIPAPVLSEPVAPAPSLLPNVFSDLAGGAPECPANDVTCNAFSDLHTRGILNGRSDGTADPEGTLNRAEVTKYLGLAFFRDRAPATTTFRDVPAGEWYSEHVRRAVAAGFITGYPDGGFRPASPIIRAEYATMLGRASSDATGLAHPYVDVDPSTYFARHAGSYARLLPELGERFGPEDHVSRAEAAVVLQRRLAERTVHSGPGNNPTCGDTDGGKVRGVRGFVTDPLQNSVPDFCYIMRNNVPEPVLRCQGAGCVHDEGFCENDAYSHAFDPCDYCVDGVCSGLPPPSSAAASSAGSPWPLCQDTDGGFIVEVKGAVSDGYHNPIADSCYAYRDTLRVPVASCQGDGCFVHEEFCRNDAYTGQMVPCASCADGACSDTSVVPPTPHACEEGARGSSGEHGVIQVSDDGRVTLFHMRYNGGDRVMVYDAATDSRTLLPVEVGGPGTSDWILNGAGTAVLYVKTDDRESDVLHLYDIADDTDRVIGPAQRMRAQIATRPRPIEFVSLTDHRARFGGPGDRYVLYSDWHSPGHNPGSPSLTGDFHVFDLQAGRDALSLLRRPRLDLIGSAVMSADGRYVAWVSDGRIVRRSMADGTETQPQGPYGPLFPGRGNGHQPETVSITADGQVIAMDLWNSSDLAPGAHPGSKDVYTYDFRTKVIRAVTQGHGGTLAAFEPYAPTGISPDGRSVFFLSTATALTHNDYSIFPSMFRADLDTENIEKVFGPENGQEPYTDLREYPIAMSRDGRFIIRAWSATTGTIRQGPYQIAVWDRETDDRHIATRDLGCPEDR